MTPHDLDRYQRIVNTRNARRLEILEQVAAAHTQNAAPIRFDDQPVGPSQEGTRR